MACRLLTPLGMIIRTLALIALLLYGSAVSAVAASNHRSPKSDKIEEAKDKEKNKLVPVSVPDGDPSTALLLLIGAVGLGALALRQRTAKNS